MKTTFTSFLLLIFLLLADSKNGNAQCSTVFYQDADGDGFGNPKVTVTGCSAPAGYVASNSDYDDSDATALYYDEDGDRYFVAIPPVGSSTVTHYADCSLGEMNTIKIDGAMSGLEVTVTHANGVNELVYSDYENGFNTVPTPVYITAEPGSHVHVTYMWVIGSTNLVVPWDINVTGAAEKYDDFDFEKCTTITGPSSVCEGGSVALTAQRDSGSVFTWYDGQTGGNLLYTGDVFQTPGLEVGVHTYWISADGRPRQWFAVNSIAPVINNCPGNITVQANDNNCAATVNFNSPYAIDPCPGNSEVFFHGTGSYQTWVVPENVYSIDVDAAGASGGNNLFGENIGGMPGRVQATLAVTPGETLYINVGLSDYPNGGKGTAKAVFLQSYGDSIHVGGGNGGGSTQIGRTGSTLTDTLIIAGGGGGAADSYNLGSSDFYGGNGGYVSNANPGDPNFMHGMNAAPADNESADAAVSGGGGGGYFGGLANPNAFDAVPGQGGGSHLAATGISDTIFTEGFAGGSSYVHITYLTPQTMTQTSGLPSGSEFPIGTTPVTFKYTNSNGIIDSCSFTVTVTGIKHTWYLDADGDGHYISSVDSCGSPGAGYNRTATIAGDCNDNDATKWQSALLYVDADGDGYTVGAATSVCYGATIPAGYSATSSGSDCNDANASVHATQTWYLDADNDGHYVSSQLSCGSPGAGYNTTATQSGDCNDHDATKWQSAMLYVDADGDGYTVGIATLVCYGATIPAGYRLTSLGTDCNDNNAAVHPGATEIADGLDNNCNGIIDEGFITLSIADASMNEGNKGKSNMTFTVTLSKASTKKITVQYATQNGTAIAGSDYTSASGTLTFKAGATKQTINICLIADKIAEPNETFKVNLSNAVNATIARAAGTGTIINDDGGSVISSAIAETNNEAVSRSVKISPNPASSILNVDLSGFTGNITMQLINLQGKVLKQEKTQTGALKQAHQQIRVADVTSGSYILIVMDEKGNRQTKKVIIMH